MPRIGCLELHDVSAIVLRAINHDPVSTAFRRHAHRHAWVPALGDAQHGFPCLSGAGRLVLKDTVILAGG